MASVSQPNNENDREATGVCIASAISSEEAASSLAENQLAESPSNGAVEHTSVADPPDKTGVPDIQLHGQAQKTVQRTIVDVYMEMVICRKITTQQVDVQTGNVLSSSFTTEEDPPVIMDIHRMETVDVGESKWSGKHPDKGIPSVSRNLQEVLSSARNLSGPFSALLKSESLTASALRQKVGQARVKTSSSINSGTSAVALSTVSSDPDVPQNETLDDDTQETNSCTSENRDGEQEKQSVTEGLSCVTRSSPRKETQGKSEQETGRRPRSAVTTRRRAAARASPLKKSSDDDTVEFTPKRHGSGRPARTIKRPRKFGAYNEESFEDEDQEAEKQDQGDVTGTGHSEDGGIKQLELEGREVTAEEKALLEVAVANSDHVCTKCGKTFVSAANCARHIQRGNCMLAYNCTVCAKLCHSGKVFERHMQSHRDESSDGKYRCSDCKRVYVTRGGYLKHKREGTCFKRDDLDESGTVGDFRCALCDTRFKAESMLKLHIQKTHNSTGSKFECKDCGRLFFSKQGIGKHQSGRSCIQPLRCLVCGKTYPNKARESFKMHMKHHLAEAEGIQYQCEDCGRTYLTPEALKKHKLKHSNLRPHKCPTCNKTFPMRYMVREHMRTHTGAKPYLCNLCGISFGNRGHLYRHIRSHELGTLSRRGRPRKNGPILLKIAAKGKTASNGDQELIVEDSSIEVMQIKNDPTQSDQEPSSSVISGPTYITVHTTDGEVMVDGEVTHGENQSDICGGQLQHVVMQSGDMTEPMVIQVIRDLTGATAVYQQVEESQQVVHDVQHEEMEQQTVVTTTPAGAQRHIVVASPRTQHSMQPESSSLL